MSNQQLCESVLVLLLILNRLLVIYVLKEVSSPHLVSECQTHKISCRDTCDQSTAYLAQRWSLVTQGSIRHGRCMHQEQESHLKSGVKAPRGGGWALSGHGTFFCNQTAAKHIEYFIPNIVPL